MRKIIFFHLLCVFLLLQVSCRNKKIPVDETGDPDKKATLLIYTALDEVESNYYFTDFTEKTGIKIIFNRLSSNDIRKRLQKEKDTPRASVIYGGTTDLYIAAVEEGLIEPYHSVNAYYLSPPFRDPLHTWSGIYIGAIGFATNTEMGIEAPTSWNDLLKPEYKGLISMADPGSSGTAYTIVATLIQIMGREKAFQYMEKLNANIKMYTDSGIAPAKLCGQGEVGVGISFHHDILKIKHTLGQPIKLTFPVEGVGYEIGAIAMVKNAPAQETAKQFIDYALSRNCQDLYGKTGFFRIPLHPEVIAVKGTVPISEINIIDYDFEKFGKIRDEITQEWNERITK